MQLKMDFRACLEKLGFSDQNISDFQILSKYSDINLEEISDLDSLVKITQAAWFRKSYQAETIGNASALIDRWVSTSQSVEQIPELQRAFQRLGLIGTITAPPDFSPDVVILLGCIEPQVKHRLGCIPLGYSGEVVVHSNQRGLVHFLEPMCYDFLSVRTGLSVDEIKARIGHIKDSYDLALPNLQESTRKLREIISPGKDFKWPDYKDLYTKLYTDLLKVRPDLIRSSLVFDDPPVLGGTSRIYTTFTEAQFWSEKYLAQTSSRRTSGRSSVLALSSQPFVTCQDTILQAAIGQHFEICTVGPSSEGILIKDCFESLAKVIFEKARQHQVNPQ